MPRRAPDLKTWGPSFALIALTAASAMTLEGAPSDPRLVAAFFPPWWSSTRIFRAGVQSGEVLGFGAAPGVVILHSETGGLAQRAAAAGALLTVGRDRRGLCIS